MTEQDNTTIGLIHKFNVERTDGRSRPGGKHDGCDYFVLDLTHDAFALPALMAYERACQETYPALAADLRAKIQQMKALRWDVLFWHEERPMTTDPVPAAAGAGAY